MTAAIAVTLAPILLFALTFGTTWLDDALEKRHRLHEPRTHGRHSR